ncbi:regulation of conidiation [Cryphonectria parasitica EP155]|uniref:Regulation of conidiation n=1 Tax=Cryphonectria parasitica (strain ATCC 38755 / EP155) TaxID=660469 RepID=A0A9P4XSD0_CRYP1|nr:regulation of conidiation [Cryphonectria parasitica EP155]KAF3759972.1 regulation of conidiation [Cryphonectria parasitica EP155]
MDEDSPQQQQPPPPQQSPPPSHERSVTPSSTIHATTTTATTANTTPGPPPPPPSWPIASGTPGQFDSSSASGTSGTPNATASGSVAPASSAGPASSKRRRGLGVVTPNACTECRKKRAKCDGVRPCARCKAQKDVECIYEIPVRQSKENLRTEIEHLRRQQRSNESVLSALARHDQWEEVVRRLRAGQSVEAISEWLSSSHHQSPVVSPMMHTFSGHPSAAAMGGANFTPMAAFTGVSTNSPEIDPNSPWGSHSHFSATSQAQSGRSNSHPDVSSWPLPGHQPQTRVGRWVEDNSRAQIHEGEGASYRGPERPMASDIPEMHIPATTWTGITSDKALVQHLLMLYFCWEYPTFASLSKEHFLKDFQAGRQRFCSPMLVNALLALGCRFSRQPSTLANPDDPYSSGDHFFTECQRLYHQEEDHHSLTTIQALGIMSIREASCGRDSESWYYAGQSIRLAIEMGLHHVSNASGDPDEVAVQAATFWGAFSLDHAWSLATGSLPQCSCYPSLPPKPTIIGDIEASVWIPYTDDGVPLQRSCEQPSNVRSVYNRDLLNIYTQFLNWYDRIPEVLRLGHNFTPAVLFAHMYYHFAILLLFRPFIKLRIIGSSISPRDVCCQAADAIQGLLRSYSQLYTLRRTPSFVPYFVLTSSIMHLAIAAADAARGLRAKPQVDSQLGTPSSEEIGERVTKAINQGIADLTEMAPCHHFAEQALNILRYLAKKWNIEIDQLGSRMKNPEYGTRPVTHSLNFFTPNVREQDYVSTFGTGSSSNGPPPPPPPPPLSEPTVQSMNPTVTTKVGDSMENPLFWPFPMQGRPMLPSGDMLREAGFELLY